jgi:hypothetical protein
MTSAEAISSWYRGIASSPPTVTRRENCQFSALVNTYIPRLVTYLSQPRSTSCKSFLVRSLQGKNWYFLDSFLTRSISIKQPKFGASCQEHRPYRLPN